VRAMLDGCSESSRPGTTRIAFISLTRLGGLHHRYSRRAA
jgi:hypothetical protein